MIPFLVGRLLVRGIVTNFYAFFGLGFFCMGFTCSFDTARGGLAAESSGNLGTTVSNELLSFELKFLRMSLLRRKASFTIDAREFYAAGCIRALAVSALKNILGISPCSLYALNADLSTLWKCKSSRRRQNKIRVTPPMMATDIFQESFFQAARLMATSSRQAMKAIYMSME